MKITLTIGDETTIIHYDPQKRKNQISHRCELDNVGVCRVAYRSDEWNEFPFNGKDDFIKKLAPCVELELLRFLGVKR